VAPPIDVYALGVLLYWCLSGRLPFSVGTTKELLLAHQRTEPGPIRVPGIPNEVRELCLRCLAKQPGDRPPADEVARVLRHSAQAPVTVPAEPAAPAAERAVVTAPTHLLALSTAGQAADPTQRSGDWRRRALPVLTFASMLLAPMLAWPLTQWTPHDNPLPQAMAPDPGQGPVASCDATFQVNADNGSRLDARVTMDSPGAAGQVSFTLNGDAAAEPGSPWRQEGRTFAAEYTPAGLTFSADYRGIAPKPEAFYLNHERCTLTITRAETSAVELTRMDTALKGHDKSSDPGKRGKGHGQD
jgi:eukaryotic-like serine/threonine-protein kinase